MSVFYGTESAEIAHESSRFVDFEGFNKTVPFSFVLKFISALADV